MTEKRNSITLRVPQGIGDIFWIYQKFSPYFKTINFQIQIINNGVAQDLQKRSEIFLKHVLPQVGSITCINSTDHEYHENINVSHKVKDVMTSGVPAAYFSCNKPLEDGIRLEAIDPDYPIERKVSLYTADEIPFGLQSKKYILFYTSGNKPHHKDFPVWHKPDYIKLIQKYYAHFDCYNSLPLVFIGAGFDTTALQEIKKDLDPRIDSRIILGSPLETTRLLTECLFFVGYQSGLNILADNQCSPQVMLYFDKYAGIVNSWPIQENIDSKSYLPYFFTESPDLVYNDSIKTLEKLFV